MMAFAANSVLNRWAVGQGHTGAMDFAGIRVVDGAVMLTALVLWERSGLSWPGRRGRLAGVPGLRFWCAAALVLGGVGLATLAARR